MLDLDPTKQGHYWPWVPLIEIVLRISFIWNTLKLATLINPSQQGVKLLAFNFVSGRLRVIVKIIWYFDLYLLSDSELSVIHTIWKHICLNINTYLKTWEFFESIGYYFFFFNLIIFILVIWIWNHRFKSLWATILYYVLFTEFLSSPFNYLISDDYNSSKE